MSAQHETMTIETLTAPMRSETEARFDRAKRLAGEFRNLREKYQSTPTSSGSLRHLAEQLNEAEERFKTAALAYFLIAKSPTP